MATDKDYHDQGLTARGIKNARRIDEWLELVTDEVTEMTAELTPWEVRDFIVRCVNAIAVSDQRVRAYWRRKNELERPSCR